jgi:hypothetical protein
MSFIIKEAEHNSYVGVGSFEDTNISMFPKHPSTQDNHRVEAVPLILWNLLVFLHHSVNVCSLLLGIHDWKPSGDNT